MRSNSFTVSCMNRRSGWTTGSVDGLDAWMVGCSVGWLLRRFTGRVGDRFVIPWFSWLLNGSWGLTGWMVGCSTGWKIGSLIGWSRCWLCFSFFLIYWMVRWFRLLFFWLNGWIYDLACWLMVWFDDWVVDFCVDWFCISFVNLFDWFGNYPLSLHKAYRKEWGYDLSKLVLFSLSCDELLSFFLRPPLLGLFREMAVSLCRT